MSDVVDRVVRKNTNNESTLPLTISAQYGLVDQITYFNNRVASRDVSNYYLITNGEFAYNKSTSDGYPFGTVKRLDLYEKGVLSTLYIVFAIKNQQEINSDFMTVFFDTDRWHKGVAERAAEGARNHGLLNISAEDFFDIDLAVPKKADEQAKIGTFVKKLDNLITLHQCKESAFSEWKDSGFLQKHKTTWEQRKLGDIGSVSMCRRIFKEQTSETGDIPFYKIGTFGGEPDAFISTELFEEYKAKYPYPKKGDILISASGSIGRTVEFTGEKEYFQDSNIVWLNHDEHLDNTFLKCFYNVVRWSGLEGSTIKRLYNDNILKTEISVPSIEEQREIGAYFEQLDNLITLHQCKCDYLIRLKYGVFSLLNKTDWEQRKLSSLCDKFTDGDWIEAKDQSSSGVRLIQTGNVGIAEYIDKPNNKKWVSNNTFEALHCEEVFEGDILISRLPEPAGRACIVPNLGTKMITAVDCTIVRVSENTSNEFLLQYLSSQKYFDEVNTCLAGGTRQRISRSNLANFDVPIPTKKKEQEAIGSFFNHLDHLITLHQQKLKLLKQIKKAMVNCFFYRKIYRKK